jgi:hypothetical protein
MCFQQSADDILILFSFDRAGRVNETTAAPDHPRGAQQNAPLPGRQFGDVVRCDAPANFRVVPERPRPGTRCIDQHAVKGCGLKWQPLFSVERNRMNAAQTLPGCRFNDGSQTMKI